MRTCHSRCGRERVCWAEGRGWRFEIRSACLASPPLLSLLSYSQSPTPLTHWACSEGWRVSVLSHPPESSLISRRKVILPACCLACALVVYLKSKESPSTNIRACHRCVYTNISDLLALMCFFSVCGVTYREVRVITVQVMRFCVDETVP